MKKLKIKKQSKEKIEGYEEAREPKNEKNPASVSE